MGREYILYACIIWFSLGLSTRRVQIFLYLLVTVTRSHIHHVLINICLRKLVCTPRMVSLITLPIISCVINFEVVRYCGTKSKSERDFSLNHRICSRPYTIVCMHRMPSKSRLFSGYGKKKHSIEALTAVRLVDFNASTDKFSVLVIIIIEYLITQIIILSTLI